ncbi:hypothetical protein BGZ51_000263 [Haplosporangium sp. Z 767]|nr:hypothetical protein BGZ51_000263 [Haplosporangium sp. Z 767]
MDTVPGLNSNTTKVVDSGSIQTPSSMDDIASDNTELATPVVLASHHASPITLKGTKTNIMLGATAVPHPLAMSADHNSLHHFQANGNHMYAQSPNSAYIHAALGPLSSAASPAYSTATIPSSTTAAFMAMHGHNTSLYDTPRRNSVPTLTVGQAERKRKVTSEEKTLHRQASWSNLSSSATPMQGFPTAPLPGLHHQLNTAHIDPSMVPYYRSHFTQQNVFQQQHSLSQVMPSTTNSSTCPSPMPESFMPGTVLNNINSSPIAATPTLAEIGAAVKMKRNNSICSTTSVSSAGSASSNKHPCKFQNCGWTFKRYEHLKRHMLVHSKERPYVCDFMGCNKTFSRSDNFSAHLRTHSKKSSDLGRRDSMAPEGESSVKEECLESQLQLSSQDQGADSAFSFQSMSQEPSEYGRDYSPTRSSAGTPLGQATAGGDEESFSMMNHSSYTFDSNAMYSMDPMDQLSSMVPRFDTIRLDLKSVAPGDIHKQPYEDESQSEALLSGGNPNDESSHPSPMPHYEHFTFPTSISTHFMPIMHNGFPLDHSDLQQQQQQQQSQQLHHQSSHESLSSGSFSSIPSAGSSVSSTSSFNTAGYHAQHGFPFTDGVHTMDSELHYSPSSPMNEDGSIHSLQSHAQFPHGHPDFYDAKVAGTQVLHHPFPSLHSTSMSALPPHPLMSSAPFTQSGMNESLYPSSSPVSSVSSSLAGSRGTTNSDSVTGSANGHNTSNGGGNGSKHGGSGKHHTCSVVGCSKRFKRLEHLKRHIKTHTLERPFNCPYATCTKKFSRSDNLSQHVKTHQRQLTKLQMKQRNQAQAQAQAQQAVQQVLG